MRLAIDCRGLRTKPTGIPNFVVTAINGIASSKPDWQLFLLSNAELNEDLKSKLIARENIYIVIEPLKGLPNFAIIWYFTKINILIKRIQPDLFWAPAFLLPPFLPKKVKTLVTVHDMVFKKHRKTMSGMNRMIFELLHDRSVKGADMLWVNSDYTREGVEYYFPDRACKEIFTGFFINPDLFKPAKITEQEQAALLQKFGLKNRFLLFVGTHEPRKNIGFLLSLMPLLSASGYTLLVVGAKGWGETHIIEITEQESFPGDSVVFAGFVTSEELVQLYQVAAVYVSTSLNEGFGMPQLEAMACGCPVVSPHNSAMIEVVEGAGETVRSWKKEEWVNTILKVDAGRDAYIARGFARVEKYKRESVIRNLASYIKVHL